MEKDSRTNIKGNTVHIAYVGKKMADFQIFHTKSKQIFKVKLGYFGAPFWQNCTS